MNADQRLFVLIEQTEGGLDRRDHDLENLLSNSHFWCNDPPEGISPLKTGVQKFEEDKIKLINAKIGDEIDIQIFNTLCFVIKKRE